MPEVTTALNPSILLVEDDKAISTAVQTLLAHYGYEVTLARTLNEAKKLIQNNPALVILDLMLPDGDGLDLMERMRATGSKARVIILTGSVDPDHERRMKRLKPSKYFRKPLNFFELLEGIRAEIEDMSAKRDPGEKTLI